MNSAEADIAQLCDVYTHCVFNKDYQGLSAIYHEGILAFDLWGKGVYDNKRDWADNLKNWLTSLNTERVMVNFEGFTTKASGDIGFAHGFVTFRAIDDSNVELRKMKNRVSWGLVKEGDNWLIAHQHTSVPIDFATTNAIFFPQA